MQLLIPADIFNVIHARQVQHSGFLTLLFNLLYCFFFVFLQDIYFVDDWNFISLKKKKKSREFNLDFDRDKVLRRDGGAFRIPDYKRTSVFWGERWGEEEKGQMQIRGTVDDAAAATAAKKSRTLRQLRLLSAPSDNPLPFTFAPDQRAGRTQSTARGRENSSFFFFFFFPNTSPPCEPGAWILEMSRLTVMALVQRKVCMGEKHSNILDYTLHILIIITGPQFQI